MDLQRSLLIGAIAVLSFMLLTEWVAFKEERAPAPEQTSRLITNGDAAPSDLPEPALPDITEEDLPDEMQQYLELNHNVVSKRSMLAWKNSQKKSSKRRNATLPRRMNPLNCSPW